MSEKQQWGSRLGVILAVSGSAVGLGNFLRFPGNAAANGGGAFMIPYFISFLLLGIPIGWAEWTMGRYGGRKGLHSAPAVMGVWGKGGIARYMGAFGVLIPLAVYFYYVMIESWCLCYAWNYFQGGIGVDATAAVDAQVTASQGFLAEITGSAADGFMADGTLHQSVVFWIITSAINIFFVYRGLSKGIEKFCSYAMPLMAVCALVILVRVLTLPSNGPGQGVLDGLNFMWNPDFDKLSNPQTWLAAGGQIFFSLSVGFGVIINYASYLRRKDDVVLSGLTSSATNEFFEVALGGMITLTASVVFMGVAVTAANTGGTFSTGFHALPVVFARMPFGNLFGGIWFFMLFLAAITSSLSMLQPSKAFFEEALGLSRKAATTLVATLCLGGNLFVLWFSRGLTALDTIDFWVGTFMIFVVAGTQIICFGWITGVDKGLEEAHKGSSIRIPNVFRFIIKYVSPAYLLTILGLFCYYSAPGYVRTLLASEGELREQAVAAGEAAGNAGADLEAFVATQLESSLAAQHTSRLTWMLILGTIVLLMVTTYLGTKRWRALGLDIDGRDPPPDGDEHALEGA
jgi:NSS family neurotransmitter:Na+ symporter